MNSVRDVGRRELARRQRRLRDLLGSQISELRAESGVTQAAIARAAGIDQAHVSRIERGLVVSSLDVLVAIAAHLGADLSVRLFPTAGERLRDRLQAPMVEAVVRRLRDPWRATAEVPVLDARGVIDLVLRNQADRTSVACEAHSQLRSVDLVLRRLHEKRLALARLEGGDVAASSLLILRSTEATRRIVRLHRMTFASTLPGRSEQAVAALEGRAAWPGPTLLWVRLEGGRADLLARPPRGIEVGR